MAMSVDRQAVLGALSTVKDPDLGKDLVSLNMIQDLDIQGERVSFRVVLTTPACPMKAKIEADCRNAVGAVAGVRDIQVKMDSQVRSRGNQIAAKNAIPGVQNIIAVSSGKGGVGKSTVSVNLATALALEGARVGLMDADIYGPNIPTMMGVIDGPKIVQRPGPQGVQEVFVPPVAHGVKVMSMGFLTQGDQPMIWRGPMLHNVVNQFCHMVDWGQLDYLVVDMPPGTGDVQLSLAQLVPVAGTVMVTTPQEVALQDVRKAFHMWDKVKIPVVGVVENMSYFMCGNCSTKHELFGSGGGEMLQRKLGTPLLAKLPIVPTVRQGGDEGTPAVLWDRKSEISQAFVGLARTVAQKISILTAQSVDPRQIVQIGRFD
ncbi:MAG: Mrp/NBP35 family ATP-binding protein [Bacteriovoracia bacterium]